MTVPFYAEARQHEEARQQSNQQRNSGHPGLWYEKFFNKWNNGYDDIAGETGKADWIKTVAGRAVGDKTAIDAFKARQQELITALSGEQVSATLESPFVTGLGLENPVENGFLWHPVLGAPYLPGSSVKGMLRAFVRDWMGEEEVPPDEVRRLFGGEAVGKTPPGAGAWIFFDALPAAPVPLALEVMTPHDDGWRLAGTGLETTPSDWVNPNPIPFLVVEAGAKFSFAFAPRPGGDCQPNDLANLKTWLRLSLEIVGAGAKTAIGFGRMTTMTTS